MSFSPEWEQRFASGKNQSLWPWSEVVSAVMRNCAPYHGMRVLEVGCGVGANARFFLESGCSYYGIEGSPSAVRSIHERLPDLRDRVVCGDFTKALPFTEGFDVVIDRSALTHNAHAKIEQALREIHALMRPGATYIGIDWFSTEHTEYERGITDADDHTLHFSEGRFSGLGRVHFADEADLRVLFSEYQIVHLEHKTIRRREPEPCYQIAAWNIVARRA